MAGYILKIVIEDTHPPVWRRILIPEKITFEELHRVIQIIFGWTDEHLHDFQIPSENICIDDGAEPWADYHYVENETLVEQFLLEYNWVRYTYDFGDDWRHKIIYEKTDENYEERYVSLLKAKGDNFPEDSGGVWGFDEDEWDRYAFDKDKVEKRLKKLFFPTHDELDEAMEIGLSEAEMAKMAEEFLTRLLDSFKSGMGNRSAAAQKSKMSAKIDRWKKFTEDSLNQEKRQTGDNSYSQMILPFLKEEDMEDPDYVLEIVPGVRTCAEILGDLSMTETEDYCKYLQIPISDTWVKRQMADAIAQEFCRHPEYLLYVLEEKEYKEFLDWVKLPCGKCEIPQQNDTLIKALALGLADVTVTKYKGKKRAKFNFAKDIRSIMESLRDDIRKQTYRELNGFSQKLEDIILAYGIVDFDSLYGMFEKIYHKTMEQEDFCRYVYWYARYNNLVQTLYSLDGTSYVAAKQLDAMPVLEKMLYYSEDLDYILFSKKELRKMADNIGESSEWVDTLFTMLCYEMQLSENMASQIVEKMYSEIMNGYSLSEIMSVVDEVLPQRANLMEACELWEATVGLMLDLELPMLKGRSRNRYAEEKNISPWDIGMTDDEETFVNSKDRRMFEFPLEIQEAMFDACSFLSKQDMEMLWQYKTKEKIQSEEYICLLTEAYIISLQYEKAEKLIRTLKKSSLRGKEAAQKLQKKLEMGMDTEDDWEENPIVYPEDVPWVVPQPYVREAPKIGRNDPCPCGSGKKYKRCCGRNIRE